MSSVVLCRTTTPTIGMPRGSERENASRSASTSPWSLHSALTTIVSRCHDRREVLALADALSRLAPSLPERPLPRSPAMTDLLDATHLHVLAASWALTHCAMLGEKLSLTSSQALRVAAAAQLVLQAAPWSLAVCRAAIERHGLQAALRQGEAAHLAECCAAFGTALAIVFNSMLVPLVQRDAAAAFAGSTARPEVLLPVLLELALTLLALPAPEDFADDPRELSWHAV